MKLVYTVCWGVGCYIWYSEKGTGRGRSPPTILAVPNVTAHPSTASVLVTVLLLLCGVNVPIKGLIFIVFNMYRIVSYIWLILCLRAGETGFPGAPGPDARSGFPGPPGFTGATGVPGIPGGPGASGGPGFPGQRGSTGWSGTPGGPGKYSYVIRCTNV